MKLTSFLQNGQLTIVLAGEIDHHSAKEFIRSITLKIEAYTPKICVLDFQEVTFMDSSGIAVAINALRSMTRADGKLMVSNLQSQPLKVFKTSGIDHLIELKELQV